MPNPHPHKLTFFLPNIFTALNLACGFASIILSWKGDLWTASMIIILGATFDLVDGRVARMTGTQSPFGEQFDSMSDVVSFGVAPAIFMYNQFLIGAGRIGAVAAFIYLLCGALRLARFNANIDKVSSDFFQGIPIPGAAIACVGYVQLSLVFPELKEMQVPALIYIIVYGLLMITNIPFNSFKNSTWVKEHKKRVLFFIFIILSLTFSYYQIMIASLMGIYVIGSFIYFLLNRGELADVFHWKGEA
ncbi:MAG: CDP-diacylglycerol--serine O-phosphatidyltransferase [Halobacteriovoraceae bacterium]|jgi:CDP-diacylglycerol---serine O-phosphatidyltransferase|nr:CDP-diacylglycerol--serine O-phosphatidyltransferase [Halobacteriovoraceae bacterium]MBT5093811.1 CDP-diacylglycerol--serine O-phosphatidyltransferase [Halobacteriovoraceae bacterium]